MNNIGKAFKENKILIIVTVIVILLSLGIVIFQNIQKSKEKYNPEINEYNDVTYIKKNYKVNEYSVINMSEIDLLNAYLKKFLTLQTTNIEKSYDMLSKESKEQFHNDIEEYKKYVKEYSSIYTKDNVVKKYRKGKSNQKIEIVDSEGFKYIITEKAIWDIEITLNGRE